MPVLLEGWWLPGYYRVVCLDQTTCEGKAKKWLEFVLAKQQTVKQFLKALELFLTFKNVVNLSCRFQASVALEVEWSCF